MQKFLVVGGSHGIGFGIVQRFHAIGTDVTVVSRTADALASFPAVDHVAIDVTADEIDGSCLPDRIDGLAYPRIRPPLFDWMP